MRQLLRRKASDLGGLDIFTPWLVVALLFYTLRRLEVWLHQHIFKVGWLVTKQYQTTTILYYAFFLPGILLNQFIYWASAGFLNVRAERSIAWPEKQEIGELKLSFVQLSNTVGPIRLALISITPLLAGLIAVSLIANNALNVPAFFNSVTNASASGDLLTDITRFTSASDFWIWFYLAFTISNTMIPRLENLRGWRYIGGFFVIVVIILYAVGAGNQVIMDNLRGPVTNSLNALSSVFAIIIGIDIFMVAVLGTIEALIERITGDSATFENGKMITMRRSELLAMKQARALAPRPKPVKPVRAPSGPPSVYKLLFPIPGAPGKEAVTRDEGIVISPDPTRSASPAARPDLRGGPAVIPGTVTNEKPATPSSTPAVIPGSPVRPALSSPTAFNPSNAPSTAPATTTPGVRPSTPGSSPTTPTAPGARPAFSPSPSSPLQGAGGVRPSTPSPGIPSAGNRPPLSPSPSSPGSALPGGRPALPSANPAGALPGNRPPVPSSTASPARPPVSSAFSPSPKPSASPIAKPSTNPFASEDEEDSEDMDDVFDDFEEEADDNDEADYEDFDEPA